MEKKKIDCFTIDNRYYHDLSGYLVDKPTPTTISAELRQNPNGDHVLRAGTYVLINKFYLPGVWVHNVRAYVDRVETRMVNGYEQIYTNMTLFRPNHKFE